MIDETLQSNQYRSLQGLAVIHVVGLPSHQVQPLLEASEVAGFGFRQHSSVETLFEAVAPSAVGCVLIGAGENPSRDAAVVNRISSHFLSMPLIGLLSSDETTSAVALMQQGAFSVLTMPVDHETVVQSITAAVEWSMRSKTTVQDGRDASMRMREATDKEREVLELMMEGKRNKEIAAVLGITVRAVEDRRFRLMRKVKVESVPELVATAVSARYYDNGFASASVREPLTVPRECLRGIEVWTPTADGSRLTLTQCSYRDAASFHEATKDLTFQPGEGFPGRIWEQREAMFLEEPAPTEFVRRGVASAVGVTAVIGFPVFSRGEVRSVVLLLLDSRQNMKTAFESWQYDRGAQALKLATGSYINCSRLRRLSEFVHLPPGEGMPGRALEQAQPISSIRFTDNMNAVRGVALVAEQFVSGVALPLTDSGKAVHDVLSLFNSESTPVFSLVQIWKPDSEGTGLVLTSEQVDGAASMRSQMVSVSRDVESSIAGEAWRTGRPVVADSVIDGAIPAANSEAAPTIGLAVPTIVDGLVTAVTVLAN